MRTSQLRLWNGIIVPLLIVAPGMVNCAIVSAAPPATSPVVAYTIQPDDVLDISVVGEPDMTKSVTVLPDGKISYAYVGEISVVGLTVKEVQKQLTRKLALQLQNPEVIVSLSKRAEQIVSVLGAVGKPGQFAMKPGWRILDLLAESGGLTALRPEWSTAMLVRSSGETMPVDLLRLIAFADPKDNLTVTKGDILIVRQIEQAKTQVQVLGEVVHPGAMPVPTDGSIASVLAAAGGPTPSAALTKATILRGDQTIPVDLQKLVTDGKPIAGTLMQAGDVLVLPTNQLLYAVLGAVEKPGAVPYPENKTIDVLSALSLSGGPRTGSDLKKAVLIRPATSEGKQEVIPINLWAMSHGDLKNNYPLKPGDVLFIPDKPNGRGVQDLSSIVSALANTANWLTR